MFCHNNRFCFWGGLIAFVVALFVGGFLVVRSVRNELKTVENCVLQTRFGLCTCSVEENLLEQLRQNAQATPTPTKK